jgi:hypothetical protein
LYLLNGDVIKIKSARSDAFNWLLKVETFEEQKKQHSINSVNRSNESF